MLAKQSLASIWSWSTLWYPCQLFLKSDNSEKACLDWNCSLHLRVQPAAHFFARQSWIPTTSSSLKRLRDFAPWRFFRFTPRTGTHGSASELLLKVSTGAGPSGLSQETRRATGINGHHFGSHCPTITIEDKIVLSFKTGVYSNHRHYYSYLRVFLLNCHHCNLKLPNSLYLLNLISGCWNGFKAQYTLERCKWDLILTMND